MQQDINRLLQAVYDEFQMPLRILAVGLGVPTKDIDDLVQETIIAFYEHYPLDMKTDVKRTMLITIITHKCIDYFRRYQKERIILDADEFIETQEHVQGYGHDLMDQIVTGALYEDVKAELSKLSHDLEMTARLHLLEGYTEKEVAEKLGISGVACRARISRARKFLRENLGPKYGF